MNPIYRWSGQYFGFVANGRLFDRNSTYLGWLDDGGRAWKADGQFLGELIEGTYIMRRTNAVAPVARIPLVPPVPPVPPIPVVDRVGRVGWAGWTDALKEFT